MLIMFSDIFLLIMFSRLSTLPSLNVCSVFLAVYIVLALTMLFGLFIMLANAYMRWNSDIKGYCLYTSFETLLKKKKNIPNEFAKQESCVLCLLFPIHERVCIFILYFNLVAVITALIIQSDIISCYRINYERWIFVILLSFIIFQICLFFTYCKFNNYIFK